MNFFLATMRRERLSTSDRSKQTGFLGRSGGIVPNLLPPMLNVELYVTDDGGDGNPWDSLPTYWQEELDYLASLNSVSEPISLALMGFGLAALGVRRKLEA